VALRLKLLLDCLRYFRFNPPMQTLGLSSSPRSENRLKTLFWPSIHAGNDVDDLGSQGYWVCAAVAVFSSILLAITGRPISGVVYFLFFYLGGVGVREHSRYAATVVFAVYAVETLLSPGILKVFLCALLLSNVRATWIAHQWKPGADATDMPMRLGETWSEKFVDKFPQWLWPKVRLVYYTFSLVLLGLEAAGVIVIVNRWRS
jgi:hypothetical protein